MPFQLDGDAVPTSRTASRRAWISTAEGIVARVSGGLMLIEGDAPITLRHALPGVADLCALLGRRVRTTLVHVSTIESGLAQTLTIAGDGAVVAPPRRGRHQEPKPLLIAHVGPVKGLTHTLGKTTVYVALSQRPGGPMVFGTSRMQSLVRAGDHVRVRDGDDERYVMHFTSRGASDASYVIVEEGLWRGPPSTRRS